MTPEEYEALKQKMAAKKKKKTEASQPEQPKAVAQLVTRMNKTEAKYAQHLEMRKRALEIIDYRFEEFKIVLGFQCTYLPDFFVVMADKTIEIHEVKGFWRDDARVKIKAAARLFPWFKFVAVQWKAKQWKFEEITP